MAAGAPQLGSAPAVSAPSGREAALLRSRRELRPGLLLACASAWSLAMARLIDVSEDGKAMLLFGMSFSIVVAFAAFLRPRWYLLLVIAYLPYSRVYGLPVLGIPGLNMTNVLLGLGVAAIVVSRSRGRPRLKLGSTEILVLVFAGVASLSLWPSWQSGSFGLGGLAQTYRGWLAPVLFFFIARGLIRDREDVAGILEVLAWTTALVAANTWKEGLDRSDRGTIESARVKGLMEQANSMGAFLTYYGIALLALAVSARPWRRGLPYYVGFLLAARATLYTFSRGAYLAMAAGSGTVLLFGNPALLAAAAGGGVVALAFFPSLIPESVRERLSDTTSERSIRPGESVDPTLDRSSAHRIVLWKGAARMIDDHPLLGVGLGRFTEMIGFYTEYPLKEGDANDAHNAYLLQAAEMGLPSLVLLLLVYLALGRAALRLRRRRRPPGDRRLGLAFLGSLIGVLVSCMLGSRFSDEALIGWFWILAATVLVAGRFREPRRLPGAGLVEQRAA